MDKDILKLLVVIVQDFFTQNLKSMNEHFKNQHDKLDNWRNSERRQLESSSLS